MYSLTALFVLIGASRVLASPIRRGARAVTALSVSELNSFAPYTHFARAAYCEATVEWDCGDACNANADFQPSLIGGDGDSVPYWYVGYWPTENAVVVAHEGTDPTQFESVLTDINIPTIKLDTTLFPGTPSVQVHSGFSDAHAASAAQILAEVKKLIENKGAKTVVAVGHSLGGALAELDTLYFTLNLPTAIEVKGVTFGTPRVGNTKFTTFFDSKVSNFKRINNEQDPVPILPGRFLGFNHPAGEVHILGADDAVSCPDVDDSIDADCTTARVPNVFAGDISNHLGPYQGIWIGAAFC